MREVTLYRVYPEKIMVSGDRVELISTGMLSSVHEPDKSVAEFASTRDAVPIRAAGRTVGVHETERLYFALEQPLEDVLNSAEGRAFACERELKWEQGRNKEIMAKVRNASLWQRIKAVFVGYGGLTK